MVLIKRLYSVIVVLVFLSVFVGSSFSFSSGDNGKIYVKEAWARVSLPGVSNSVAYMALHNESDKDDALLSVSGKISKVIELHTMVYKDGMMSMKEVDSIAVPKDGKAVLKPGGLHIMLIGLHKDLKKGDKVKLRLNFKNSKHIDITVPVKPLHMGMMGKHGAY